MCPRPGGNIVRALTASAGSCSLGSKRHFRIGGVRPHDEAYEVRHLPRARSTALGENPTLALERDFELIEHARRPGLRRGLGGRAPQRRLGDIASPEVFIAAAAAAHQAHQARAPASSRLPYHHPLMVADRMVLLDHLTRGRVMFGVGPGALPTDALMLGHRPEAAAPAHGTSRWTSSCACSPRRSRSPTRASGSRCDNARLHLRPFTQPHMPIAVAAVQSPAGMVAAGEHGAGVLTMSVPRGADGGGAGRNSGRSPRRRRPRTARRWTAANGA